MVNQYHNNDLRRQKQFHRVAILQRELRVLKDYHKVYARITADVEAELLHLRAVVAWSKKFNYHSSNEATFD